MELFERIRREHEHGVGTTQGVARKLEIHRRMVRQALQNAVPPQRKVSQRQRPKLGPAIAFIEEILHADQKAPRKQRHSVRAYVRKRKQELGLLPQETFIPHGALTPTSATPARGMKRAGWKAKAGSTAATIWRRFPRCVI